MDKKLSPKDLPRKLIVRPGTRPRLVDEQANRVFGWDEARAKQLLDENRDRLEKLQYQLYADRRFGLLVVFQAFDAGGKDGTIRKVITAFNPQGCTVASFKTPTAEELKHDYLWRIHQHVPRRGEVGVFNRSHYEDVVITRVDNLVPKKTWQQRYQQINEFERMLVESDIHVVKFFLHISRDEQKRRFADRLAKPHKQWKFDPRDLEKRKQWNEYRAAFEAALTRCSTPHAPWYVIPADCKWFRNAAVSEILVQQLEKLPLRFPRLSYDPANIRIS